LLLAIAKALLLLVSPVVLFMAAGIFMMQATGRARFRQRRKEPTSRPLNFRFRGYDAEAAAAYWHWLGPEGLAAEVRFLKADMAFPLWYGGCMVGSIYAGWVMLGQPISMALLTLPVLVAVLADWVENMVHLHQIARFRAGHAPEQHLIRVASFATSTKLLSFWVATGLIGLLAGGVLLHA
jgi:hypothetical protein